MKVWQTAFRYLFTMTLLTGILYPLAVAGLSRAFMMEKAEGSLVLRQGQKAGSRLLGQKFEAPKYFWARPSATDYDPQASAGSNLGPTSQDLVAKVAERREALLKSGVGRPPKDLLFASGSGLDPHISPEAAFFQLDRVANARSFNGEGRDKLRSLVQKSVEDRQFGILGEARVNVLELNLALDEFFPETPNERSHPPQS